MVKLIKAVVFVVFAFITGLNVYKSQTEAQLSDIQMKNVEALANNEYGDNPSVEYAWSRLIDCDGWFTGDYQVCQKNGPGNACYMPGDTTCDCGRNCD